MSDNKVSRLDKVLEDNPPFYRSKKPIRNGRITSRENYEKITDAWIKGLIKDFTPAFENLLHKYYVSEIDKKQLKAGLYKYISYLNFDMYTILNSYYTGLVLDKIIPPPPDATKHNIDNLLVNYSHNHVEVASEHIFDTVTGDNVLPIEYHAKLIAENEIKTAFENIRYIATDHIKTSDVWVTKHDNRVRATHQEADGQKRDAEGFFRIGVLGWYCRYPRDPMLPLHETINCRCIVMKKYDNNYI